MDDKIKFIAKRIEALREILEFSIEDVAKELNMSVDEYDKFEKGHEDFPFSFLYTLANKFGVDVVDLMTGETPHLSLCSLVKNGHGLKLNRRKEYEYRHLAYIFKNKKMEPFLVTVRPDDIEGVNHKNSHEGQELNYIVEGSIMFYIDDQEILAEAGDTLYYDAKHPHAMKAVGGKSCKFLAVIAK